MTISMFDVAGALGAVLIVGAYLLLQTGRIRAQSRPYSAANAAGAALVLVSLIEDYNLGALLIESFWLLVSLYGLARATAVDASPKTP